MQVIGRVTSSLSQAPLLLAIRLAGREMRFSYDARSNMGLPLYLTTLPHQHQPVLTWLIKALRLMWLWVGDPRGAWRTVDDGLWG